MDINAKPSANQKTRTKKWATEVAQNALRALFIRKTQRLPPLWFESLQMNNPKPAKKLSINITVITPAITA
jgi:hypothetical protein